MVDRARRRLVGLNTNGMHLGAVEASLEAIVGRQPDTEDLLPDRRPDPRNFEFVQDILGTEVVQLDRDNVDELECHQRVLYAAEAARGLYIASYLKDVDDEVYRRPLASSLTRVETDLNNLSVVE